MEIFAASKTKKREVATDAILVLSKLLDQNITVEVRQAIAKKLEILINEL